MTADLPPVEPTYAPLPDIAAMLDQSIIVVRDMVRTGALVAVRRGGTWQVPVEFVAGGEVLPGLAGTITLLKDAGFTAEEIIGWLFQPDASLGGNALTSLANGHRREVHRRAQTAGF